MMHDGVGVAKEDHLHKYLNVSLHPMSLYGNDERPG